MSYKQLTYDERYQKILKKAEHDKTQIAEPMGCYKIIINLELRRRLDLEEYRLSRPII